MGSLRRLFLKKGAPISCCVLNEHYIRVLFLSTDKDVVAVWYNCLRFIEATLNLSRFQYKGILNNMVGVVVAYVECLKLRLCSLKSAY